MTVAVNEGLGPRSTATSELSGAVGAQLAALRVAYRELIRPGRVGKPDDGQRLLEVMRGLGIDEARVARDAALVAGVAVDIEMMVTAEARAAELHEANRDVQQRIEAIDVETRRLKEEREGLVARTNEQRVFASDAARRRQGVMYQVHLRPDVLDAGMVPPAIAR